MARRRQEGNLFFRLDVDFFSDRKVKILKARYGADGITLYLYLLCEIYSVGIEKGFLQTDEVRKKENMPPLGMKFIKLGLQDGLYDPESNKVIVLNTSKTLDLTKIKEGGDDPGE